MVRRTCVPLVTASVISTAVTPCGNTQQSATLTPFMPPVLGMPQPPGPPDVCELEATPEGLHEPPADMSHWFVLPGRQPATCPSIPA